MALYEVMNVGILQLQVFTVATAPDATKYTGAMIYVSNGKAGSPILAFSNGTNWIRVDDGATAIAAE